MTKLTARKRDKIVKQLVNDMNEWQTATRYWFETENLQIHWMADEESYVILRDNGTWEWLSPSDVEAVVGDFSDETLANWYAEEMA